MRAYPTYVDLLDLKEDDGYKPVLVAMYVEDIMVVANVIGAVERLSDVLEAVPFCLLRLLVPFAQGYVSVRMTGDEPSQV